MPGPKKFGVNRGPRFAVAGRGAPARHWNPAPVHRAATLFFLAPRPRAPARTMTSKWSGAWGDRSRPGKKRKGSDRGPQRRVKAKRSGRWAEKEVAARKSRAPARDPEDGFSLALQRSAIKFWYVSAGNPPQEEWDGLGGAISKCAKELRLPPGSFRTVESVFLRVFLDPHDDVAAPQPRQPRSAIQPGNLLGVSMMADLSAGSSLNETSLNLAGVTPENEKPPSKSSVRRAAKRPIFEMEESARATRPQGSGWPRK